MADNSFTKFVPGFDFLQGLVKNAGAALPGIGQWVAPTLNPEELEKRIEELRTVQFWLEQNARMLNATIQALEVQRMTLSTLKTMNVPLTELRDSLKMPEPQMPTFPGVPGMPKPKPARKTAAKPAAKEEAAEAKAPPVDPMQWWGALSQQFTQLAANAMKDQATDAAKNLAGAMVKQSFDAAGETLRKAASMPGAVASSVAKGLATKPASRPTAKAAAKTTTRKR
ncbi:PhaM family polyhydroxyalkanoate granule multifunctional regulatory protein [Pelomonas sp. SE-A7]|uniref:PhaM family polyhydroxyalkanoate granule multifunctional regulatory protein n=1 Tax=Pelomonas sp. SE-A7 TaxID=3054953 RepID=UPI00259CCAFA|nr:PhaM family polyhydroxyalkanoate granule multifunctional regulatory protein [Pelomonas sp. SE-A7]MDM4768236.1 hypothetical protein [Pelomonas sp. SE-A7]